jgi:hypothetical protein
MLTGTAAAPGPCTRCGRCRTPATCCENGKTANEPQADSSLNWRAARDKPNARAAGACGEDNSRHQTADQSDGAARDTSECQTARRQSNSHGRAQQLRRVRAGVGEAKPRHLRVLQQSSNKTVGQAAMSAGLGQALDSMHMRARPGHARTCSTRKGRKRTSLDSM